MFGYYLELALRSFRSNKAVTALMVLAIGLGIGASMTTLTVYHVLSADPLPGRGERVFNVQLDVGPLASQRAGGEPEQQLTRFDAEALLREGRARHQAMMAGGGIVAEIDGPAAQKPRRVDARYSSADFFAMFGAPFAQGRGWTAEDDAQHARVAVISSQLAEQLYGSANPLGRSLRLQDSEFRVIGVLGAWRPVPHFYDVFFGEYVEPEDVYLPLSTAHELVLPRSGSMNCWARDRLNDPRALNAACSWIQYWVELDSAAEAPAFLAYLNEYSARQQAAGRFERAPNARLRNVQDWLRYKQVLPGDVRLQLWLALGFLLVCLLNTVGLLLSRCLRAAPQIGLRRALGASRAAIFSQFLVEAGLLGLFGGLLGLALAWLGLMGVRQSPSDYARLAALDLPMLLATLAVAVIASLLAGVLPAWRAAGVPPALHLKAQ
ncbi:ABC transporter permease [Paucibacter sp. APW11]|uniref:ABC transporter permease n=1 Tax=Roseateles aquae TaxID=3077235 RepID=A0ABU3PI81_9BURK|nr:ABC transporter permease [Paucibacter sp. APW11]MDT9001813.1 ABC transporter permease [Paucibacter sp. APW11]